MYFAQWTSCILYEKRLQIVDWYPTIKHVHVDNTGKFVHDGIHFFLSILKSSKCWNGPFLVSRLTLSSSEKNSTVGHLIIIGVKFEYFFKSPNKYGLRGCANSHPAPPVLRSDGFPIAFFFFSFYAEYSRLLCVYLSTI